MRNDLNVLDINVTDEILLDIPFSVTTIISYTYDDVDDNFVDFDDEEMAQDFWNKVACGDLNIYLVRVETRALGLTESSTIGGVVCKNIVDLKQEIQDYDLIDNTKNKLKQQLLTILNHFSGVPNVIK